MSFPGVTRLYTLISVSLLLLLSSAPSAAAQQTYTSFDLYKNSGFGPCPGGSTGTGPSTTDPIQYASSQDQFCAMFGGWTVLPTTPNPDAFYTTWLNFFISLVSTAVAAYGLFWCFKPLSTVKDTEVRLSI